MFDTKISQWASDSHTGCERFRSYCFSRRAKSQNRANVQGAEAASAPCTFPRFLISYRAAKQYERNSLLFGDTTRCSHFANAPAPRTPCSRSPELCYGNVYMPACWHCSFGPATTPSSARGPPTPRSGSQSWRPWPCAQRWKSGRPRRYRSTLIKLAWWAIECAHFLAWYFTIFEVLRRSHGAARTSCAFALD
jgi:hypothetical protein